MDGVGHLEQGHGAPPELVRQIVVQSALYDVDIRFAIGVLMHQGMGLARWPLKGWMEFSHLEQRPRAPQNFSTKVWCKTPYMMWTSNLVLGS